MSFALLCISRKVFNISNRAKKDLNLYSVDTASTVPGYCRFLVFVIIRPKTLR